MFDVEKLYDDACHVALHGCGCSYELYVQKLTKEIDRKAHHLPSDQATALKAYAEQKGDYAPEALDHRYDGCCAHGIDYGCCPAGCEAPDDGEWDSEENDAARDLHQEIMAEFEAEEEQTRLAEIAFRDAQVLDRLDALRGRMSS